MCILLKSDLNTGNVIKNAIKIPKQQKIVFKTSLLWSFTSKKAEICASNDVSHFFLGSIRKVSFFEVGSKLKFFFFNHMPDYTIS